MQKVQPTLAFQMCDQYACLLTEDKRISMHRDSNSNFTAKLMIFTVMSTTYAVVRERPDKKGDFNPDLCDTGAVLFLATT